MKLPNAPLLEVFFELQWDVPKTGGAGALSFGYDPGFNAFESAFEVAMNAAGYTTQEVVAKEGPTFANRIVKRVRKGDDQPFPLIQIGHGIFACNVSTDYEWNDFRAFCLDGLDHVLECYPTSPTSPFRPSRAELRYVDVFNKDLLGHESLTKFLKTNSKLTHDGLGFLNSEVFTGADQGQMVLQRSIANAEIGWFRFDVANATTHNKDSILLTSRVVKDADFAGEDWAENTRDAVCEWLGEAHNITSEFFSSFVSDDLMESFKQNL